MTAAYKRGASPAARKLLIEANIDRAMGRDTNYVRFLAAEVIGKGCPTAVAAVNVQQYTLDNARVGMIFADVEEHFFDDADEPQDVAGSLYEVIEIVTESAIPDPLFKPYARAVCVDHDDSEDERTFAFPFDGYPQASGVQS